MTLIEKYEKLSSSQKVRLKVVKDEAGLNSFLSEMNATLSDDEKQAVLEYLETSKLPLSIGVLEDVAGGKIVCSPKKDEVPKVVQGQKDEAPRWVH